MFLNLKSNYDIINFLKKNNLKDLPLKHNVAIKCPVEGVNLEKKFICPLFLKRSTISYTDTDGIEKRDRCVCSFINLFKLDYQSQQQVPKKLFYSRKKLFNLDSKSGFCLIYNIKSKELISVQVRDVS